jgi:hypothetical protein
MTIDLTGESDNWNKRDPTELRPLLYGERYSDSELADELRTLLSDPLANLIGGKRSGKKHRTAFSRTSDLQGTPLPDSNMVANAVLRSIDDEQLLEMFDEAGQDVEVNDASPQVMIKKMLQGTAEKIFHEYHLDRGPSGSNGPNGGSPGPKNGRFRTDRH